MIAIPRIVFKVAVLISLFLYFFPFQLKILPLSNARILQIMGAVCLFVYIIYKRKLSKRILYYAAIGIFIFMIGVVSTSIVNHSMQFDFALTKGLYIIFYSFEMFFIVSLMKCAYKPFTITKALEVLIWVTLIQAIISLVFFCWPNSLDTYNSLIVIDDDYTEKIEGLNAFRLTGVGSVQFANSAVHYGIALWVLILLYICPDSIFYKNGYVFSFVAPLFCICGILSARTFFIFLLITMVYIVYIVGIRKIGSCISIITKLLVPIIFAGALVVTYLIARDMDAVVDWSMELFVNMKDDGSIETSSTNDLKDMYILPTSTRTWLIGDGRSQNNKGFYMDSDVGYIRSLFYWGIIGSIAYFIGQILYCDILKKYMRNSLVAKLANMILIWCFIYNLKEFWAVEPYWVFLLFLSVFAINNTACNKYHYTL